VLTAWQEMLLLCFYCNPTKTRNGATGMLPACASTAAAAAAAAAADADTTHRRGASRHDAQMQGHNRCQAAAAAAPTSKHIGRLMIL
jgi:hypothetical protein